MPERKDMQAPNTCALLREKTNMQFLMSLAAKGNFRRLFHDPVHRYFADTGYGDRSGRKVRAN